VKMAKFAWPKPATPLLGLHEVASAVGQSSIP